MDMTGREIAPHIRMILKKDRDWGSVSRNACRCGGRTCTRRWMLAETRLTRRAIQLYLRKAVVRVHHGDTRTDPWLYIVLRVGSGRRDSPSVRKNVRELLADVGIKYRTYQGRFGPRPRIRLSINDWPYHRL